MKHAEYIKAMEAYRQELARQDAKASTGSVGKLAEVLLRKTINKSGLRSAYDFKAHTGAEADVYFKTGWIEIKTGHGAIAYADDRPNFTKADFVEENIFPTRKYVIWAPFLRNICDAQTMTEEMVLKNSWFFTRDQFIECLTVIGKNGLASSLKVGKGGYQLELQTITPRMEDRLWDYLENIPTTAEWLEELRG